MQPAARRTPRRTMLVTGASDGIGAAAARRLARDGHRVIVTGRSSERTHDVARAIGGEGIVADLARLDHVRALPAAVRARVDRRRDVVACNAGGIMRRRSLTEDGNELTLQVNHLAHVLLVDLLMDELRAARGSVVVTSSAANSLFGRLDLGDLQHERRYSPTRAYGDAKLAGILFARGIEAHHGDEGVHAVAFHPGVVSTSFSSGSSTVLRAIYRTPVRRLLTTPEHAGETLAILATGEAGVDWLPGAYYDQRRLSRPSRQADDPALVEGLWRASRELVGLGSDDTR